MESFLELLYPYSKIEYVKLELKETAQDLQILEVKINSLLRTHEEYSDQLVNLIDRLS